MNELIERIIPRLSDEERRVMSLPTVQLAMLNCSKGVLIENRDKPASTTIRSLKARGLVPATGKRDPKSGVLPLTNLGEQLVEQLGAINA